MASPDKSKRKILKAKKTMPTSCRKQIEILNKSKNTEALKTTAIGSNVPGNNVSSNNQNLSTSVITGKCIHSENVASSLDSNRNSVFLQSSEVFPQNLIKPLEEIVNSAAGMEYVYEEDACPHQKPSKVIDSPSKLFIQEAKYSGNTFENHSENHFEYQAAVTRSFFELEEALKSICSQPSVLSDVIQIPKSTVTNTLDDKRMDKMASHSETNFNAKSHDKRQNNNILSSDLNFVPVEKMPLLVNSVNSICAADVLKTDISSRTCHSSISNCESKDTKWQLSLDADNNHSHYQKKRIFSENKENVKRMKTTEQINENICVALERQTALLEQVRHLIRQEICSINYKLFDNKLKELKERIGKTQCMNKHEAIADELFAKIAKLQRRIKTVRLSQRNCLEPNMRSSNTTCEVVNSESMNLNKNPESFNSLVERITSVNYEPSSNKTSEKINLLLDCDDSVSESNNDDVMLISVESPNLTPPITSNPTDIRTITLGNSNNSPSAETEVMVLESFEHLPPLPEPPPLLPELSDKIRDTLPPQKPELKVKRVLRPQGIALTWNISKINPKCAPVESYHLFLCHENFNTKLIWKKIGEIKALPLPMACTLSQFLASNKYYFTVQSKDIFGRYGPFCDIKSISGFSENFT
ncbi:activating transcription factor 7-interacting protein 2 isoform X3 [Nycticebus coucang]|uniref:activating transcription factor 7-interacting protein 2 isoform X3 n=1 Tax=Nycticebus coucang TaxID=9470 RepID=UPI00234CD9B9|nr:activating transcription factor 7-interacting protein 2 isoform X3 [Nycticebus coucang]